MADAEKQLVPGRYKDCEKDPHGFWEHDEHLGWRWHSREGDPKPGNWRPTSEMRDYAPFTRIPDPGQGDPVKAPEPEQASPFTLNHRMIALDFASRLNWGTTEDLITSAKDIEAYLTGN